MVIDVRKLKYSGKEECSFHFEYEAKDSDITLPNAEYKGVVKVNGTLTLSGKDVYVDGEIEYSIATKCSRCYDDVIFHNIVEFSENFSETDENEDSYRFKKGLVDLTEMVDEKLLLSLPFAVYCKEDCKGLCPECGANLNHTKCEHTIT